MQKNTIQLLPGFHGETAAQQALYQVFATQGLSVQTYQHPAIFTMEEGIQLALPEHIPGQHGKSLFLITPQEEYWLLIVSEHTRANLKETAQKLGVKRFSFAKPEQMEQILGVRPGSATPFALLQDTKRQVKVVLDEQFLQSELCVFHPLDNRFSTQIAVKDLIFFIKTLGYDLKIIAVA